MTHGTGPAGRHRVDGRHREPDPDGAASPTARRDVPGAAGTPVGDRPAVLQHSAVPQHLADEGLPADRALPADESGPVDRTRPPELDRARPVEEGRPADPGQPRGWDHPTVAEHPVERGYRPVPQHPAVRDRPGIRQPGDRLRALVRGTGELLVTCGAVLLLFVVYEVWASNLTAARKQARVHRQLVTAWQHGQDPLKGTDRLNLPVGKQVVLPAGQGFANLYIPAFGKDYARTVVQGTSDRDLEAGPGHYVTSQLPGQVGNFAVAGHRVGKGEPFLNLDRLRPGDTIVVQTAGNWYVYSVLGSRAAYLAASRIADRSAREAAVAAALAAPDRQGVRGREIVSSDAVQVIAPVPDHPQARPTRALLTLTTCHPKYSADRRLVVHAQLVRAVPHNGTVLPKELPGGTS